MSDICNPLNDDHYSSNDAQIEDLKDALREVVSAARDVIDRWERGNLASAVNNLESAIQLYEKD